MKAPKYMNKVIMTKKKKSMNPMVGGENEINIINSLKNNMKRTKNVS